MTALKELLSEILGACWIRLWRLKKPAHSLEVRLHLFLAEDR